MAVAETFTYRSDWHQADRASGLVRHYQAALEAVLALHPRLQRCVRFCSHCGIRYLTDPRNVWHAVARCPFGCSQQHRRRCASRRSTEYYQTASGKWKKKQLNSRRSERPTVSGGNRPTWPDLPPPDHALPDTAPPDLPPPDHAPPDHALPDHALPDHAPPDLPRPDLSQPDPAMRADSAATANSLSCRPEAPTASADPAERTQPEAAAELRVAGVVLDEARIARSPVLPYVRMVASLIEGRNIELPELIQALQNAVRQHRISRRRRVDYGRAQQ